MGTPNLTGPSEVPTDAKRMEQAICELCGNPFLREVGSKETVCKRKDEVLHWKLLPDKHDGIEKLMRIHYKFFMANDRFWYEKDLIEADAIICIAASNLRKELANG